MNFIESILRFRFGFAVSSIATGSDADSVVSVATNNHSTEGVTTMAKEWYEEEGAEVEATEEMEVVEGAEAEAEAEPKVKHTLTTFRDQIVAEFIESGVEPKAYIDQNWESIRERMFAEFPEKLRSAPNQRRKLIGQFNAAWKELHPAGEEAEVEDVEDAEAEAV